MTSEVKTWRFKLKLPNGEPVLDLLVEAAAQDEKPSEGSTTPAGSAPTRPTPVSQGNNGDARMTEPQKRYLFRLLGAQGVQGKDAELHLKQWFKVQNLREISKAAASEYINQLAADRKEAHGGA
jgi:hypothetical protein